MAYIVPLCSRAMVSISFSASDTLAMMATPECGGGNSGVCAVSKMRGVDVATWNRNDVHRTPLPFTACATASPMGTPACRVKLVSYR